MCKAVLWLYLLKQIFQRINRPQFPAKGRKMSNAGQIKDSDNSSTDRKQMLVLGNPGRMDIWPPYQKKST